MKRVAFFCVCICVLLAHLSASGKPACAEPEPDSRIEKKLTCTLGYARLHDAVSELRTKSGVSIECGANPRDWQVRDLPVFISVREMPLGRVLTSLATATHVELVRQQSSSNKQPTYRLMQTQAQKKLIDGQLEERVKAGMDYAKWAWDAMAAYGRSSDVPLASSQDSMLTPEMYKAVARVIASLDPRDEERLFSGQIKLRAKDCKQADLVLECGKMAWDLECSRRNLTGRVSPVDLRNSFLIFHFYQVKSLGYTGLIVYGGLPDVTTHDSDGISTYTPIWSGDLMSQAAALADQKRLMLPPKPDYDASKPLADPPVGPGLAEIVADDDWKSAFLQEHVAIPQPTSKGDWKCADALKAAAETGHLNIICEDFRTHRLASGSGLKFDFAPNVTAADALREMGGFKWFADPNSRLLVGWDQSWRFYEKTLVEQSFLDNLKTKLNRGGVQLDDYVPLVRLSIGQIDAWINRTRDLAELDGGFGENVELWKLYDALGPDQKRLANTSDGLPLSSVDPSWLSTFLSDEIAKSEKGVLRITGEDEPAEVTRKRAVYSDPKALGSAVLRITKIRRTYGGPEADGMSASVVVSTSEGDRVVSQDRFTVVELRGTKDGNDFAVKSAIPHEFPVRRTKRP